MKIKEFLFTGSIAAFDHKENGVVTYDILIKAVSKKAADDICFQKLMEKFPANTGHRYTHRIYTTSPLQKLLTGMNISYDRAKELLQSNE